MNRRTIIAVCASVLLAMAVAAVLLVTTDKSNDGGATARAPENQQSTSTLEALAQNPVAVRAYLDPRPDESNHLLDALFERTGANVQLLEAARPSLAPYPSLASVADAVAASTRDPADPASQRIAHRVFFLLGGGMGKPGCPPDIRSQIAQLLVTFLASGDINVNLDQPSSPSRYALALLYGGNVNSFPLPAAQAQFTQEQYGRMFNAELSYASGQLSSARRTGPIAFIPAPVDDVEGALNRFGVTVGSILGLINRASGVDYHETVRFIQSALGPIIEVNPEISTYYAAFMAAATPDVTRPFQFRP